MHSCSLDVGTYALRSLPFYAGSGGTEAWSKLAESSPDLILTDALGNRWNPRDLAKKTTFVTMWASRCAPCRAELPYLPKLYQCFRNRSDVGAPERPKLSDPHRSAARLDHIYIHLPIYEIVGTVIASCTSLRRCLVFREKSACQIHAARSC